jgi:hypothetical protein
LRPHISKRFERVCTRLRLFTGESARFTVVIPANTSDKAEILAILAEGLRFPGWFGWNWDALYDMLGDLTWLAREREVRIVHEDVPEVLDDVWSTYLSILTAAVDFRNSKPQRGFEDVPRLIVVLPSSVAGRLKPVI